MSILGTKTKSQKKHFRKTIIGYSILALVAIGVNFIYGLFAHGVDSPAMTWMFLYPLLGGVLIYFLIDRFIPDIKRFVAYRIGYNSYNSGIAALTTGSFLLGILEIAGTNSPYIIIFTIVGWLSIAVGLAIFGILAVKSQKSQTMEKEDYEYRTIVEKVKI